VFWVNPSQAADADLGRMRPSRRRPPPRSDFVTVCRKPRRLLLEGKGFGALVLVSF
jgi:hypothetical protein